MNYSRLEKELEKVNSFTDMGKGINRIAYTDTLEATVKYLISEFEKEGLKVRVDSYGNVFARREGEDNSLPPVAFGSHVDTVYEGGRYDGTLGVILGLEIMRTLNDQAIKTLHPTELIIFACEESSRFGTSTMGSKAVVGGLKVESIEKLKDRNGILLGEAMAAQGFNIKDIEKCKIPGGAYKAFLELHIEQGSVLEEMEIPLGVVTGIAAPTRFKINIKGRASHSGATPMTRRKDALVAASQIVLDLETAALGETERGTVGTVGTLVVSPGAMNVVPGYCEMQVDIRGIYVDSKKIVEDALMASIEKVKVERNVEIETIKLSHEDPVLTNEEVQDVICKACDTRGYKFIKLPSGAGHDTMNMAKICPTGMIFVPSKEGLSHNPEEYTSVEEINKGAGVMYDTVLDLAVNAGK